MRGWTEITELATLVDLVGGPPSARARDKGRPVLTDLDRQWLAASPCCVLATAGADGTVDASPKGDPAGRLVHVLDERTVALAERPGNRRVDGYRNVLTNPHAGLLFLVPGRGDTLRVNGRARLVSEAPFLDDMVVDAHRPTFALVVDVEEVFFHCARALLRARLWEPETWDPTGSVPTRATIAREVERDGRSEAELDEYYGPAYRDRLYR